MTFEALRHLSSASFLPQLLRPSPSGAPWELPAPRCPFQRVTCLVGEATERPSARGAEHVWPSMGGPPCVHPRSQPPTASCSLQPRSAHLLFHHTPTRGCQMPRVPASSRPQGFISTALTLSVCWRERWSWRVGRGAGDLVLIRKTVRVHRGLCPRQPTAETVIMGPSSWGPGIEFE